MIWEIERAFGIQALAMIGSGTSKSGIWDKVADVRPKVILIDELEKMKIRCILKLDPDSPIQKLNLFPEQDQPG